MNQIIENILNNIPIVFDSKINFIKELLNHDFNKIIYHTNKFDKYYILFEYIIKFIIDNDNELKYYESKINYSISSSNIISCITMLNKGQKILHMFKYKLDNIFNFDEGLKFLKTAASYGTLCTFLFWLNYLKLKNINNLDLNNHKIIINLSIKNPDIRLYNYILENTNILINNDTLIKENLLIICNNNIKKNIIKKLKIFNKNVDLNNYIYYILSIVSDISIIFKLYKYYTIKYDFNLLNIITNNKKLVPYPMYDILNTTDEHFMLNLLCMLKYNICIINNDNIKLNKNRINNIIDNYILLIDLYFSNYQIIITSITDNSNIYNNIYVDILNIFINNNLINKFIDNQVEILNFPMKSKMLLYSRFYTCVNKYIIKNNLLLHYLRMKAKYIKNKKLKLNKIYKNNLLNEILMFEPNHRIKILSKGSYQYQLKKQEFTYNNSNDNIILYSNCIIHMKNENILVKNIPMNIFPNNEIINSSEVKAEYIEELDLYLIIDINIPNTTIIERYNILRNLHSYTKNTNISKITNLNEFHDLNENEQKIIDIFLLENKHKIVKWYPKFMCYIEELMINDNNFQIISL